MQVQQAQQEQIRLQSAMPVPELNLPTEQPRELTPQILELVGDSATMEAQRCLHDANEATADLSRELAQAKADGAWGGQWPGGQ